MTLVSFAPCMLGTFSCFLFIICGVLGNPGVTHSVPTAFMMNAVGTDWVTPGLPRMHLCISFPTILFYIFFFSIINQIHIHMPGLG